jgi:phosphoesterase RecJ-like protein
LGLALRSPDREVTVGFSGTLPKSLEFLVQGKDFLAEMNFSPDLVARFDLLVLVDCLTPWRVWPEDENNQSMVLPPYVSIDHHADPSPSYHLACFVDPKASATAELVFKIVKVLEAEFSPPIVEALLAALISDTGSFSQANSTSECLRQASFLVSMGGNIEYINHYLKGNWSITRMHLLTEALGTITLHHGGRVATMLVTQAMLDETGSSLAEAEGLVEYPLLIHGVDIVALLKVNGLGRTRVSLRCRPGIDVRELAMSQGGGGHKQASAYLDDDPDPGVALKRLLPLLEKFLALEKRD